MLTAPDRKSRFLGHGDINVSFEFFPPRTAAMEETLWRSIRRLEPLRPSYVSVTYGAGGSTRERTHATVARVLKETKLKPAAHLTCVDATREEVDAVIRDYWDIGVRHIVALRGDPAGGVGQRYVPTPGGYINAADLTRGIKNIAPFDVSVACYPEKHPESPNIDADIDMLWQKIDAGASTAITQFFFDNEVYFRYLDRVRDRGITIPIVPGIIPIHNFKQVSGFAAKSGASVPEWLGHRFEGLDEDQETRYLVAAAVAAEQVMGLVDRGITEFHFYTLNRADLVYAICHLLGLRPGSDGRVQGGGRAMTREQRIEALKQAAKERILILDGAMGTMIQRYKLDEAGYRGTRFKKHSHDLKGNNDLLVLTQPKIISEIHNAYLEAGADILETNTFNAQAISQSDYGLADVAFDLNVAAAKLAREAADAWTAKTPDKSRFVAGAIGPTNRTASLSPDVNNPGFRNVSFDALVEAYSTQARGLIEGGVDIILIETIFDTLNAKAAGFAVEQVFEAMGVELPIMLSDTITDLSGRNLSGQTPEAFWYSLKHLRPFSVGLNCSFGAEQLRPSVDEISHVADTLVSVYPNAGLPNEMGEYDETPKHMAGLLEEWARDGLINIVGGCCGTTPDHIRAIAAAVAKYPPRHVPEVEHKMRLSGLEPFVHG